MTELKCLTMFGSNDVVQKLFHVQDDNFLQKMNQVTYMLVSPQPSTMPGN